MALFTVIEETNDLSGRVRVRVDLVGESVFLKFPSVPSQDDVDWEIIALLTSRENAATE